MALGGCCFGARGGWIAWDVEGGTRSKRQGTNLPIDHEIDEHHEDIQIEGRQALKQRAQQPDHRDEQHQRELHLHIGGCRLCGRIIVGERRRDPSFSARDEGPYSLLLYLGGVLRRGGVYFWLGQLNGATGSRRRRRRRRSRRRRSSSCSRSRNRRRRSGTPNLRLRRPPHHLTFTSPSTTAMVKSTFTTITSTSLAVMR